MAAFDEAWLADYLQRSKARDAPLSGVGRHLPPASGVGRRRPEQGSLALDLPAPDSAQPAARYRALERPILYAVLATLRLHPRVAWVIRMNVGAMRVASADASAERIVRFGFAGCSDILGQLRDGRFLAVEVKRAGAHPTADQAAFLATVARHGGVAFIARNSNDVMTALDAAQQAANSGDYSNG